MVLQVVETLVEDAGPELQAHHRQVDRAPRTLYPQFDGSWLVFAEQGIIMGVDIDVVFCA
jgi:hypothetical protein